MPRFSAHVQYDDWKGSAAADNAGENDLRDYLRGRGLLAEGEFLVGFELYSGEQLGSEGQFFEARAYIVEAGDFEGAVRDALASDPAEVVVREIPIDLPGFFRLFKRFNIALGQRGLDFHGRDYRERDR